MLDLSCTQGSICRLARGLVARHPMGGGDRCLTNLEGTVGINMKSLKWLITERIALGIEGWQDQYAAVFGGINFIEFTKLQNRITPLRISSHALTELEENLMLIEIYGEHKSVISTRWIATDARSQCKWFVRMCSPPTISKTIC